MNNEDYIKSITNIIEDISSFRITNINENIIHETGLESLIVMAIVFKISDVYSLSLYDEMSKFFEVENQLTIKNIVSTLRNYEKQTVN